VDLNQGSAEIQSVFSLVNPRISQGQPGFKLVQPGNSQVSSWFSQGAARFQAGSSKDKPGFKLVQPGKSKASSWLSQDGR